MVGATQRVLMEQGVGLVKCTEMVIMDCKTR